MSKIAGIIAMFLLVLVSSQPVFCEQKVEFSPSAAGSFSPRPQPAMIVGAAQAVSPASYQKIGVVSVCEKINLPDQLKKEKIEKMVMALREHAAKQGGDLIRQNEDVKKEAILKWRNVTIDDGKVTGETGPIDILSVVCKSKAEKKQETKEAKESALTASEDVESTSASECIKAEVWRAIKQ